MRDKVVSLYNLLFFKYWFLILFFSLWKFYGFAHPTAWEGKAPGWIKSFLKGPGGSWSPRLLPGPACEGWSGDHPSPGLRGSPGSHWAAVCVARSPGLAQVLHSTRMPLPPAPHTHTLSVASFLHHGRGQACPPATSHQLWRVESRSRGSRCRRLMQAARQPLCFPGEKWCCWIWSSCLAGDRLPPTAAGVCCSQRQRAAEKMVQRPTRLPEHTDAYSFCVFRTCMKLATEEENFHSWRVQECIH